MSKVNLVFTIVWLCLLVVHSIRLGIAIFKEQGDYAEIKSSIWFGICAIMAYLSSHL